MLKAHKSELSQELDLLLVKRKQLRTELDEKASSHQNVLSTVRLLVFDSTSDESRLEELLSMSQLLYEDSRKILVSAGPSLQVAEYNPRVH